MPSDRLRNPATDGEPGVHRHHRPPPARGSAPPSAVGRADIGAESLEDLLLRLQTQAFALLRQQRSAAAEPQFSLALQALEAVQSERVASAPPHRHEPDVHTCLRQRLLTGRAAARLLLLRLQDAEDDLLMAFPDLLASQTAGRLSVDAAEALLVLAKLRHAGRRSADVVTLMEKGLAGLPAASRHSRVAALRARMQMALGVGHSVAERFETAIALQQQALAVLSDPLHADLARDRAQALVNLGIAEWRMARHDDAMLHMRQAAAVFQGLVAAGATHDRSQLALVQMNLATVHTARGEFSDALTWYEKAASIYDTLIALARGRRDTTGLRASRAQTETNIAFLHFSRGDLQASATCFRSAVRRYAAVVAHRPELRNDWAHALVNQAHLMARLGRVALALRLYHQGWETLQMLVDSGRSHLANDAANARFGLARMLVRSQKAVDAAAHFDGAQRSLVALAVQGQPHLAPTWLAAVLAHAEALLAVGRVPPMEAAQVLVHALAHPPPGARHDVQVQCRDIDRGLATLERWWTAALPLASRGPFAESLLLHLLDRTALLLGESDPEELRRHGSACTTLVTRLGHSARAQHHAPYLLADWFLRTRGLRAQRSALATGRHPLLLALRDSLARLRRLEEALLAGGQGVGPGLDQPMSLRPPAAPAEKLTQDWRELHDDIARRRRELVRQGLLPEALRLDTRSLLALLPRHDALVLLARLPAPPDGGASVDGSCDTAPPAACAEVLLAIVMRSNPAGAVTTLAIPLDGPWQSLDLRRQHAVLRPQSFATARGGALRGLAAGAVHAEPVTGHPAELPATAASGDLRPVPAADAIDAFHRMVSDHLLMPVLQGMLTADDRRVALVPSGDLHLLPFDSLLEGKSTSLPPMAVYPSAGAWVRHGRVPLAARRASLPPRWALAADPALGSPAPLPWVAIERELSMRLWAARPASTGSGGARAAPPIRLLDAREARTQRVDALLAMGHGSATDESGAPVGLQLGPGHVLSGYDLSRLRGCSRVLLSGCALGRNDEVHAEPMGFLSAAFGQGCRFGVGWLIEVPDAEACLFSLALQFALRGACTGAQKEPDWLALFRQVRGGLRQRNWPPGFGDWLALNLPRAIDTVALPPGPWQNRWEMLRDFDGGLYARPPPSLVDLSRWVVALGR